MHRKILNFSVPLLLAALPLLGQQAPPITLNVSAVNLLATVRDKHGNLVRNLSKDDFTLDQDGKPQPITYFAKESDLPLTIGLLVDTSLSQRRVLDQERAASRSFLDRVLREDKDKAFLIHFDHEVELLQDLTSSREKLLAAIDQIHTPQFSQSSSGGSGTSGGDGGGNGRGSHGHGHGGGTLLYDSIYLASDDLMKKQQGRKALVILTDGVDHGSKESLAEAIEAAQRADTLIYCILFADKEEGHGGGFGGPRMGGGGMGGGGMGGGRGGGYPRRTEESRPDGKKILEQIAKTSGGRFFEVSKKETLDKIYADLDEELRNQYVLGYSPGKPDATIGYHKLHLAVKQKDLQVQTRDGFYLEPK
ncbi:MAG TPA: VWA domain-containing protein [Candidatus Acidoferrales bacterium]|nr:VWA domain-containing protein [Candidatus Acidoferrales bacterium]